MVRPFSPFFFHVALAQKKWLVGLRKSFPSRVLEEGGRGKGHLRHYKRFAEEGERWEGEGGRRKKRWELIHHPEKMGVQNRQLLHDYLHRSINCRFPHQETEGSEGGKLL